MSIVFKKTNDGISLRLKKMISKAQDFRPILSRVIYPMYQEKQVRRWDSENSTEGTQWKSLSPSYAAYKIKKYAAFPYQGSKMLVATGALLKSVVGKGSNQHRKIIERTRMTVGTAVEYAGDVATVRPFMAFGKQSQRDFSNAINKYLREE